MKISASIYSDKSRPLKGVIGDLVAHEVDLLHVDCNDDPTVFDDIAEIREICSLPIDLHLITSAPEQYFDLLKKHPVEYVTFQYENLTQPLDLPDSIPGRKGIAITTPTDVSIFQAYDSYDFILIMATVPGQSGGTFDKINFDKIRAFRNQYPGKSIHVDGGVNPEVSFILRNMGVSTAVSGSYLFKEASVGNALMNLTKRSVESHYAVKDFMRPLSESPRVYEEQLSVEAVLNAIEQGKLGFTLVTDGEGKLKGIISNADVRKGLLRNLEDLNALNTHRLVNRSPVMIEDTSTVVDMLKTIKQTSFPMMYIPVVDSQGYAKGIVTFVNLIKGEL